MTWPLDKETGKSMATWQRQHLSISCKTGFLGFIGLFTGAENYSHKELTVSEHPPFWQAQNSWKVS